MLKEITPKQKKLLGTIYNYIKASGFPPSFEEMKVEMNVVSNQSILDLLDKLNRKKIVKKTQGTARSIQILPLGYRILDLPPLIPIAGSTSAGQGMEMVEISGEWKSVSADVAELKDNVSLLKISGDSMINAGIDDGDLVLVKEEKEFASGSIVLARIGDESTVKRFMSDDAPPFVYLKPENPKYDTIPFTDQMELLGKVISVFKRSGWWEAVK